jgi:hypothetical protein
MLQGIAPLAAQENGPASLAPEHYGQFENATSVGAFARRSTQKLGQIEAAESEEADDDGKG